MYLRKSISKSNGKKYEYYFIVEGYRENGKVKQRTIAKLGKLSPSEASTIKLALSGKAIASYDDVQLESSYEYGASRILNDLWNQIGLDKLLDEKLNHRIKMMVINRLIDPKSKNSLIDWYEGSYFATVENSKSIASKQLYRAMDYLEENKKSIEEKLIKMNFKDEDLDTLFYDITSSYFDGNKCEIANFGYSRDHRSDKKQIVISLVVNKDAMPVCVEILKGNTADKSTVKEKIEELNNRFELKEKVIVADRGMITAGNIDEINNNNFKYILCMNNTKEAKKAIESAQKLEFAKFDDTLSAAEVVDGDIRYIVCFSNYKDDIDKLSRKDRIERTKKSLQKINKSITDGRLKDHHKILIKANKIIAKNKVKKFFEITELEDGKFDYRINNDNLEETAKYDGLFVITTTYSKGDPFDILSQYKNLRKIEKAFHHMKNYIELRPIYHYKEQRVKAHVFICFLSYLLLQTLENKLKAIDSEYSANKFIEKTKKISMAAIKVGEENITRISSVDKQLQKLIDTVCDSEFSKT